MKFLRNKQLKQLGAYLVLLTLVVFIAEFFLTDHKINQVEEAELKIEYTQLAQLNNQKISLLVQQFINGKRDLAPSIAALIEEQDYHLKILSTGGRMGQRDHFIKPLSALSRITFGGLMENWENYKNSIFLLISHFENPDSQPTPGNDTLKTASATDGVAQLVKINNSISRIQYEGLSLSMAQWYDKLAADLDEEVHKRKNGLNLWKAGLLITNVLVVAGLYFLFVTLILNPLSTIEKNVAHQMQVNGFPPNELGKLAGRINETIENLKDATDFVVAIGKGDFSLDYKEALDRNYKPGKNKLADSLIEMQKKLRALNEEEQKRQWANEGLTRFVDILRTSHDDLSLLCDKIISGLISYTRANQGALYILNDEQESNKYLELISLFAWDVKKHDQQRIKPGQGLLGQAFLEKETTYLTNFPEEYIRITSGLGGANPKSVLIVPLKVDKDVYGLVELASFHEFQPHEISFVEKLGETIASTLGNVRAAHKNKMLIEQFQQQTEQMRAQEEEMRQNMEELQATQEEIFRKEKDYLARIQELEKLLERKADPIELNQMREKFRQAEEEYHKKIEGLKKELEVTTGRAQQWEAAEQLHQQMRINLDALQITREELDKRRSK